MTSAKANLAGARNDQWKGLVAASLGMFLSSLDMTVNVALPDITSSFGSDPQIVQWIILFYVGSSTSLQLSLGRAADIYGLKRLYIIGLGVYTVAVVFIGIAPILTLVFALRVLQAIGNSLIMVAAPALVTHVFASTERGKALGLMTGFATLGMVTASLGGGALVDAFGWRAIFIGRSPLGILTIVLALKWLHKDGQRESKGFDLTGAGILFIGLASFILFLTLGGRNGWLKSHVIFLLVLSMLAAVAFIYFERSVKCPVFDLGLLKRPMLVPVLTAAYLMFLAIFVNWFILPFYIADTLRTNAKVLGFLLMLMPVFGAIASPLGGLLSDRMPPAHLTTFALFIIALTMFCFTWLDANSTVTQVAIRMAAVGLGMRLFQAANATLIMSAVPSNRLGTGGALLAMSRSMGTVSSVALMGALFATRLDTHTATLMTQGVIEESSRRSAFVMAFQDTYQVSTLLAVIAVFVSFWVWPRKPRK
jgi:EmrB/QacA subfamily drug resistance transporter